MNPNVNTQATQDRSTPRLAQPIGEVAAWMLSGLAALIRPHTESPAETAERLAHTGMEPEFAAEVRAVAVMQSGDLH